VLTLSATEIDLTPVDFGLFLQLTNVGHTPLDLGSLQCGRGDTVVPISGKYRGERLWLEPGQTRALHVLCDHGRVAAGDPSIRIATVYTAAPGLSPAPAVGAVVWTIRASTLDDGDLGAPLATATSDTPNLTGPLLDNRDIASHETTSGSVLHIGDVFRLSTPADASFSQIYAGTWTATIGRSVPLGVTDVPDPTLLLAPSGLAGTDVRVTRLRQGGTALRPVVSAECTFVSRADAVVTIADVDIALRIGEFVTLDHLSRADAVQRLKEARELLDLGIYTVEQFEAEKARYLPLLAPLPEPVTSALSANGLGAAVTPKSEISK
jgi:hypothetical protein